MQVKTFASTFINYLISSFWALNWRYGACIQKASHKTEHSHMIGRKKVFNPIIYTPPPTPRQNFLTRHDRHTQTHTYTRPPKMCAVEVITNLGQLASSTIKTQRQNFAQFSEQNNPTHTHVNNQPRNFVRDGEFGVWKLS